MASRTLFQRSSKIRLALVMLVVIPLGLFTGSTVHSGPSATNTLIVAMPGTVEQIDPSFSVASFTAQTVISNIYDQLTEYETRALPEGYLVDNTEKVVGAAAKSFDMPLGSKRITYRLRDGLKFHDGTPLDAKALKFSFDRIVNLKGLAYGYLDQAGARTTGSFAALDDKTLVVLLEQPNPLALKLLTLQNITPTNPKLIEQHATNTDPYARNWLGLNDAGSGPFMLERLSPASEVVLARYDSYWKGAAKLERVIIKVVPSVSDRVLGLERGAVDMITDVPPKNIAAMKRNSSITILSLPSRKIYPMGMNVSVAPFNNIKVRQAVCAAIPYDTIVKEAFGGYAARMRSAISKGTPTHTEKFSHETDLDRARSLLTEAGFPSGFKSTLVIRAGFEEDEEAAVWIKSSLQRIGITIDIETLPFGAFISKVRARQHSMYISSHVFWVNDPYYSFYFLQRSGGGSNFAGYSNREVDGLIADYMVSTDRAGRARASERIQQIVMEESPICFLAQANVNLAMRNNVRGYYFSFDSPNVTRFYTMHKTP